MRAKQRSFPAAREKSPEEKRVETARRWIEILEGEISRLDEQKARVEINLAEARLKLGELENGSQTPEQKDAEHAPSFDEAARRESLARAQESA